MKLLNKKTIKNIKCEEKEKSKKIEELKKEPKNLTSFDGYKKNKIKELNDITEFSSLIPLPPPTPYLTLFETKILAEKYLQEKKYKIENILKYDDTNKEIQKKYLTLLVNELNTDNKKENKNIIFEKIQKFN